LTKHSWDKTCSIGSSLGVYADKLY